MSVAAAFETAISTLSLVASPTPDSTDDGIDELVKAEIAEVIQPMYTALVADVPKSVGNAASSKCVTLLRNCSSLTRSSQRSVNACSLILSLSLSLSLFSRSLARALPSLSRPRRERRTHSFRGSTFVYGEISFQSYAIAFHKVRHVYGGLKPARGHGAVFYDLGSGSGKPVFAAALLHDFERVVGVELLTGLHGLALGLLEKWNTTLKPTLADAKAATSIEFFNDDITTFDFTDGDICFANSTCYDAGE